MVPSISLFFFYRKHECSKKLFLVSLEFLWLQDLRIIQLFKNKLLSDFFLKYNYLTKIEGLMKASSRQSHR